MHTAAENLKEIVASTLDSLFWWIGHQTYWGVFAWTRGIYKLEKNVYKDRFWWFLKILFY